ncbi:O-methyltransferase [Infundibulicybe gibba]|nr:O-methyltransferase [Infundibulicybe gibba]
MGSHQFIHTHIPPLPKFTESAQMIESIPKKSQILVLGGGPAGSYAATVLAREGFDVVLLEAAKFPRYHIGESMVPSCRQFLKFIDLEDTVKNYGFCKKPGATLKLVGEKREAYTDFVRMSPDNGAWNVTRADFDEILLRGAEKCGVQVFEEVRATSINFAGNNPKGRPISAKWESIVDRNLSGTTAFDYLVDATGREGIMAQKYLKHRKMNVSLRNIACWGYWKGTGMYGAGTSRENAPWFEALTDQSGWNWFIPLHNGMTSVGVVMNEEMANRRKEAAKRANGGVALTLKQHYLNCLQLSPGLVELLGDGHLIEDGPYPVVQSASDFSYNAPTYSGDHYRLVGDAAAFIDPFFSTGISLAFTGGLAAAVSIASSIRGEFEEVEVCKYHDAKIGKAYTRYLLVVLSAYKQMRAQDMPVLADFEEDNFDRAFDISKTKYLS